MKHINRTQAFFALSFFLVIYILWLMAKPMLGPIIFGAILAGVFFRFNLSIENKFKTTRTFASALTCSVIFFVVLLPTIFILISVSKEAVDLYQNLVSGLGQKEINDFLFGEGAFATLVKKVANFLSIDIELSMIKEKLVVFFKNASGGILSILNKLVGDIFSFLFNLIIMLIVSFAFLTKGDILKDYIFELSPLPKDQEEKILTKFNQMNYVTLICNGVGGVIQGVLAGIAFFIAGINSIFLWTVVMIVLAFVPLVGISIVTIPASLYLILTGKVFAGIFLFVFTSLVGLIVENWFKPRFIGDRIRIDSSFVLLTIIGGMGIFGMAGIFYGPIVGILFLTFVEIYHDNYV